MPSLVFPTADFVPFTKILSADVNGKFNAIKTLLNTTKLDSTNVQAHGLTRTTSSSNIAAGTASYVVVNDTNGDFSEEAQLAPSRGGLGVAVVPGSQASGDVPQINAALTAFTVGPVPVPAALRPTQFNVLYKL